MCVQLRIKVPAQTHIYTHAQLRTQIRVQHHIKIHGAFIVSAIVKFSAGEYSMMRISSFFANFVNRIFLKRKRQLLNTLFDMIRKVNSEKCLNSEVSAEYVY